MKRNEFLSWSFLAAMVVALPGRVKAALRSIRRDDKGFKVDAGTDRYDNILKPFGGDQFFCKVAGRDSDGDSYIYESTRNSEGGPLLHVHYEQDEWWYVLEGDYLIKVGDTVYEAKPGDFVYGPRVVPHTFSKVGNGPGRVLIGFHPAGRMEEYFTKLSNGEARNFTDEQREAMRREHGFETAGPALGVLKK